MVESTFIPKIEAVCHKKESLFDTNKAKYAVRSIFAGAFLTMTTAAGAIAADLTDKIVPGTGRFLFPFIFAWGLAYIVFLNAELVTSNMMYLTAGTFLEKIKLKKALLILFYCTFFNLIGALIAGWLFANSAAFAGLSKESFIAGVVQTKISHSNEVVLLEAVLANVFVNVAILSFVLVKDSTAKLFLLLSAVYMFVFLKNEHLAANFASFAIVKFSSAAEEVQNFGIGNILRHWAVTFVGNLIGGGLLIGLPYAWFNKKEEHYVD